MVDGQATLPGVHPILRNPDLPNRTSSPGSMSPRSQVRFSVPDINVMNESQASASESPSKIVFPKGFEEDSAYESANEDVSEGLRNLGKEGHFMDMHSRVMIDVPEEIWDFHTRKRIPKHRRSRSTGDQSTYGGSTSGDPGISKSLQSIIVDTLDSMGKFKERYREENSNFEDSSGISQVSPLNIRGEASYDLYLTPYSSLNNYNVPIPLEISLPPYLSPKNKDRKRNSLVFDGKCYSPFNPDSCESSLEADGEDGDKSDEGSDLSAEAEDSISADSIPSAVHDISFDVNSLNDVDQELGIDQDANVNLKVQRKNLKSQSPSKSSPLTKKSHAKSISRNLNNQLVPNLSPIQAPELNDEPPLDQEGIEEDQEESGQEALAPVLSRQSLDILETPSKQIHIPDFDIDSTPATSAAGSLKFFDTPEDNAEEINAKPNREVGNLNMEFKFPALPPKEDEDFIKTDASPKDAQFEARRNKLIRQKVLTPGGRRHMHNRSKSMHNVEDMFAAASGPRTVAETPGRSPLRQDHPSHENDVCFEVDKQKEQNYATGSPEGFTEGEYSLPITPTPFSRYNSHLPVTPSLNDKSKNELSMLSTAFSRREREKSFTPTPFEEHAHEVDVTPESELYVERGEESDPSSIYEAVHAPQRQPSCESHEPTVSQEKYASQNQSTYNKTDESLKIISENKLDHNDLDFSNEVENNDVASSTPVKQKLPSLPEPSPVKPMTSFQSFTGPVVPPENEYENIISIPPERNKINYNLLSPRRSLSNNGSNSSGNSQFSKQTVQSSRTSYPTEREVINPLVENLKKSDLPNRFAYNPELISNDALKYKGQSIPAFGLDNANVPSLERDDRYRQDLHGQQPDTSVDDSIIKIPKKPEGGSRDLDLPACRLQSSRFRNDYNGESYFEPKNSLQLQNDLSGSFYALHKPIQLPVRGKVYDSESHGTRQDYRSINQQFKKDNSKEIAGLVSDNGRLKSNDDFLDVLETLNNMSPSSQMSKEFSSKEPSHYALPETPLKSKENRAADDGYHTEYEERDGKLVEVVVLDDDSNEGIYQKDGIGSVLSPGKFLQHKSPNRNHQEILKMCEDTATNAKKVILQLVDNKHGKKEKKSFNSKRLSRPPPPATTKEMPQDVRLLPRQRNSRASNFIIDQDHYLKNLQRAMKPKSHPL